MSDGIVILPPELPGDSPQWWVKIVDFLQQNWALPVPIDSGVAVLFVGDTSGIFDRIDFETEDEALEALRRNEFEEFAETPRLQAFLHPPEFPLSVRRHPNGPIYSSGRFWQA